MKIPPLCQPQNHRWDAPTGTAADPAAAAASGSFPVYTPLTVLPVTPGRMPAPASSAAQSLGAAASSGAQGWLKGMVDLISNVVPTAAGRFSSETQRSATSSRLILPCRTPQARERQQKV